MATRWGIVGSGRISHDFVTALSVLSQDEHRVTAVACRNQDGQERNKEFAVLHDIPKTYCSYEELAADPDIDVAYIGNLNCDHFPTGLLMIKHGKHVLCEKPLCLNKVQVQKLVDAAREKKVFLMEAVWSRFTPVYQRLREELANKSIGDPMHLSVLFGAHIATKERVKMRDLGGGSILDIGIYCLQLVTLVFGREPPTQVRALGSVSLEQGVDESCGAVFMYDGGKMATMSTNSKITLANEAIITGTKGTIKIPNPFWCPTKLETPSGNMEVELPVTKHKFNFMNSVQLRYEAQEVRRCILAGELESPLMSHEDSLAIVGLEDQLRRLLGVQYSADVV